MPAASRPSPFSATLTAPVAPAPQRTSNPPPPGGPGHQPTASGLGGGGDMDRVPKARSSDVRALDMLAMAQRPPGQPDSRTVGQPDSRTVRQSRRVSRPDSAERRLPRCPTLVRVAPSGGADEQLNGLIGGGASPPHGAKPTMEIQALHREDNETSRCHLCGDSHPAQHRGPGPSANRRLHRRCGPQLDHGHGGPEARSSEGYVECLAGPGPRLAQHQRCRGDHLGRDGPAPPCPRMTRGDDCAKLVARNVTGAQAPRVTW